MLANLEQATWYGCRPTPSHGSALNELGGTQAQDYKDDRIEADARRARAAGNPYVLYMFQQRKMSSDDLKAVARGYYG